MEAYLTTGASGSFAERFNGLLILWEHRFYGSSLPTFSSDFSFTPSQLSTYFAHHTIEQALEDVAVFARTFNASVHPSTTPWVFVGGSYPGARAAWARLRNPDIFHASLASSAVVQLQENFWQYFLPVERSMDEQGWQNCSSDMRSFNSWVNDAIDKQNATAVDNWLGRVTGAEGTALWRYFHWDDEGDAWLDRKTNMRAAVGVVFQDFQYVGMDGWLGYFCNQLQLEAAGSSRNFDANSTGIFQDFELDSALDIHAVVIREIWSNLLTQDQIPPVGVNMSDVLISRDCSSLRDQSFCEETINNLSWQWQVCSEFGAFQVGNASRPESLLPKIESVDSWIEDCVSYFGNGMKNGPNIAPLNDRYGGWDMNPSNVMWNDGEFDPWRSVTPHSTTDLAPKRPTTTDIPGNGTAPPDNDVFGFVVPGGFHCPDLGDVVAVRDTSRPPSGPVSGANIAHTVFINALAKWLPDFVEHDVSDASTMPPGSAGGASSSNSGGSTSGGQNDSGAERRVIPVVAAMVAMAVALWVI
ncbi:hypothetical protein P167DRAFT_539908 [Morchella conica CCBAS932]|uniref:Peptidase S28 n=1 Tax=Morchella conica CCBAS932 TaxID=1392247 RepID=A0A3N4KB58_9PEZI|nr:hypothetical protein P167DRAFT_539908 [Morchella conica CCBAS932]